MKGNTQLKKDLFVSEYFQNGFNASEAYRTVYKNANGNERNLSYSLLNKDPYVMGEVERLKSEIKERISKDDLVQILYDIALNDKSSGAKIRSIEVIAKMLGYNEAEKRDININSEQPLFGNLEDEDE